VRRIIISGCLIAIVSASGCGKSDKVTNPVPTALFSGQVLAYWCAIDDPQGSYDRRYSVETGLAAAIDLIDNQDRVQTVLTDDTSRFGRAVDTGSYLIVVRTAYAFPDTFGVRRLVRDTLATLKILYDYLWVDTIYVSFVYPGTSDTANTADEARQFAFLDRALPDMLNFSPMTRVTFVDAIRDSCAARYQLRVMPPFAVWEAIAGINQTVRQYPDSFPARINVRPEPYGCVP